MSNEFKDAVQLKQYCADQCEYLLREQAEKRAFDPEEAEASTRKAIVGLLGLGGIELAKELLSEEAAFGNASKVTGQLSRIREWCNLRIAGENAALDDEGCPRVFEVFDRAKDKNVAFDTTDTEHWGPVSGWNETDTLYRHQKKYWTIVTRDRAEVTPEVTCVSDEDAAMWFVRNEISAPVDATGPEIFKPGLPEPEAASIKPQWNQELGELRLGKAVIRKVAGSAKNLVRVLDAFEEDGWVNRIDSPLDDNSQTLHETIKTLNNRLKKIKFRADGKGKGIIWDHIEAPETTPNDFDIPF